VGWRSRSGYGPRVPEYRQLPEARRSTSVWVAQGRADWRGALYKDDVADRVSGAIRRTLANGVKTRDLGGTASTTEDTEAVVRNLDTVDVRR